MKYSSGEQIIRTFCKIGSPQKLGPPSLICRNFNTQRKVLLNHAETFKIEIQNGEPNKSDFFNSESCRMHWNLMNEYEFGCMKLVKLKYRRGNQIIRTFCKIGSPQKLGPTSLICRNFNTQRKVLLNHAETFKNEIQNWVPNNSDFLNSESCRKHWNLANDYEFWCKKLLKLKYRRGDEIIQTFCKSGLPQKLGPPSLICRNVITHRKVPLNHAETFEIQIQNGGPNNSDFLNSESCTMHRNLIND